MAAKPTLNAYSVNPRMRLKRAALQERAFSSVVSLGSVSVRALLPGLQKRDLLEVKV